MEHHVLSIPVISQGCCPYRPLLPTITRMGLCHVLPDSHYLVCLSRTHNCNTSYLIGTHRLCWRRLSLIWSAQSLALQVGKCLVDTNVWHPTHSLSLGTRGSRGPRSGGTTEAVFAQPPRRAAQVSAGGDEADLCFAPAAAWVAPQTFSQRCCPRPYLDVKKRGSETLFSMIWC